MVRMVSVPMPIVFVGYIGQSGAGKDTLADAVIRANCNSTAPHAYYHTKRALADTMRELLGSMMHRTAAVFREAGINNDFDNGTAWIEVMRCPDTKGNFRGLQQQFGTEVCRSLFGEDCWVAALKHWVHSAFVDGAWSSQQIPWMPCMAPSALVIHVPDIRFPNEAKFIQDEDGILVYVYRDKPNALTDTERMHPSEKAFNVDNWGLRGEGLIRYHNNGPLGEVHSFNGLLTKAIDAKVEAIRTKSRE